MTNKPTPSDHMAGAARKAVDAALDHARGQSIDTQPRSTTPDPRPEAPSTADRAAPRPYP